MEKIVEVSTIDEEFEKSRTPGAKDKRPRKKLSPRAKAAKGMEMPLYPRIRGKFRT